MESYTLYLDEILPNTGAGLNYFCLAGILASEENYTNEIIPAINQIKNNIFDNTTVILHEADIRKAAVGTPYEVMRQEVKRKSYISQINEFFQEQNFHVLGVAIHEDQLKHLYPNLRDKYFIGLQVILENYVNFLERKNAIGNIIIESRNPKQDQQLQIHFHNLKATGTLFYEQYTLQKHLGTISFTLKADNIVGIQIADMIPNPLNRQLSGMKQKIPGLIEEINKKAYDGAIGENKRFGIKLIP
ncbi:DUF3800 domain-containing protein [Bacillus cereus]|uniref:DUF3800 domain-containing protein n=1 Tax=Bacillus thuringiensis TaxID=1428 RepID=UPI0018CE5EB9|nr:DUF3800 domain-containing protein [Bacillus thuringiensis]MEB9335641.1 DUF3800 domain-containing protein [Bacillus cereus]